MDVKRLYRSRNDRKLAGVCGGLGKYFDIDPVIFRIVFVVTIFFGLAGLIAYIIMALIVPLEPEETPAGPQQ
jgi:phage shock protein C